MSPLLAPARFGHAAPVEYVRVEPAVVVEFVVDAAVDEVRGRSVWRHPARFVLTMGSTVGERIGSSTMC